MTNREERSGLGLDGTHDLSQIGTRTEFADALTLLRKRVGLTIREVSKSSGIPTATLGGYFSGRHLPPPSQPEIYDAMLQALGVAEGERSEWREVLLRVWSDRAVPQNQRSPYRGLEPYEVADAELFFGREELTRLVVDAVRAIAGSERRLIAIVGASGVGKSSLLRAGVIASLADDGWESTVVVPGDRPLPAPSTGRTPESGPAGHLLVVDQFEEIFSDAVEEQQRDAFIDRVDAIAGPGGTDVVLVALRADYYASAIADPRLVSDLDRHQVLVGPMSIADLRRVVVEPAARAGRTVEPELVDLIVADLRGASDVAGTLPMLSHALLATWSRIGKGSLRAADYVAAGGIAGAIQRSVEDIYDDLDAPERVRAKELFAHLVNVEDDGRATRRRADRDDLSPTGLLAVAEPFLRRRILTATDATIEISHDVLLEVWPRLRLWIDEDRDALRIRRRVNAARVEWNESGQHPDGLLRGALLELAGSVSGSGVVVLTDAERDFVERSVARDAARAAAAKKRGRVLRGLVAGVAALALVATALSVYLVGALHTARDERSHADLARRTALSRQVALEAHTLAPADPSLAMQLGLVAYRVAPTVDARSAVLDSTGDALTTRLVSPPGGVVAAVRPDGKVLAVAAADGSVRFYQVGASGAPTLLSTVKVAPGDSLFAAAFSPDGHLFATGGVGAGVAVYDVRDPSHPVPWPKRLVGPTSSVQGLTFSPDGKTLLAAASDPALYRWRISGNEARSLPVTRGFGGSVQSVAVSSRGVTATGSADGAVRLWRTRGANLRLTRTLAVGSSTNTVDAVAFSPNGRVLAEGAKDEQVRVWRLGAEPRRIATLTGFTSWVNALTFNSDGSQLAAGASGALTQVWRTRDWKPVLQVPGSANVTTVAYVPGTDRLVTGAIDGVARLRTVSGPRLTDFLDLIGASAQTADGSRLYVAPGSSNPVVAEVRRTSDRRLVETGLVVRAPAAAGSIDQVVAVSPDGTELIAGTDTGHLVMWHLSNGRARLVGTLSASAALIEQVAFSPDGRYFGSVSDDGTVSIYPGGTEGLPERVAKLDGGGLDLQLTFSHDLDLLAVASASNVVHLWARSGRAWKPLPDLKSFGNYVYGVAFSPDGRTFAAAGADKEVRLYEVDGSRFTPTQTLTGPTNSLRWLDFDRAGGLLAGASQDGNVWMWRVRDGKASLYAKLGGLGSQPYTVQMDPAMPAVMGAGASGRVDDWSTDVDASVQAICAAAGSPISRQEWEQYVPGAAYAPPCRVR